MRHYWIHKEQLLDLIDNWICHETIKNLDFFHLGCLRQHLSMQPRLMDPYVLLTVPETVILWQHPEGSVCRWHGHAWKIYVSEWQRGRQMYWEKKSSNSTSQKWYFIDVMHRTFSQLQIIKYGRKKSDFPSHILYTRLNSTVSVKYC